MKKVLKFWACPTCPLRYLTHDMLNNTDIELCFNCVIFYCNSWWILILHLFCSSLSWSLAGLLKSMNNCSQVYTELVFSFVFILSFNNFSYVRLILSVLWSWWEYWNKTIITWVTFLHSFAVRLLTFQQITILMGDALPSALVICSRLSTVLFVLW